MKKPYLFKKIKLPIFSLLFFMVMFYAGYGKSLLQIFLLLSFHELFHIIPTMLLGYQISSISIYPFGLSMQVEDLEFRYSLDEIIIVGCGLISYVFSTPILYQLQRLNLISAVNLSYLLSINASILLFNSLPIYPLDGGRILHGLMHLVLPFQFARKVTILSSFFCLILVFLWTYQTISMFMIVLLFLAIQLRQSYRNITLKTRIFYIFRYLHPQNYALKIHHKQDLYRNRTNLLKRGRGIESILEEKEWIQQTIRTRPILDEKFTRLRKETML